MDLIPPRPAGLALSGLDCWVVAAAAVRKQRRTDRSGSHSGAAQDRWSGSWEWADGPWILTTTQYTLEARDKTILRDIKYNYNILHGSTGF